MEKEEYIEITLYNRAIKSFEDFADYYNIIYTEGWNIDKYFDYARKLIFVQLTDTDKLVIKNENGKYPTSGDDLKKTNTLPHPCVILCMVRWLTRETIINITNAQVATDDVYAFEDENIRDIYEDDGFVPDTNVSKRQLDCNVIGWFKSDNFSFTTFQGVTRGESQMCGVFRDVSSFVQSMNVSVSKQGGTFTISFPFIMHGFSTISKTAGFDTIHSGVSRMNLGVNRVVKEDDKITELHNSYFKSEIIGNGERGDLFSSLIQNNDLMFISFEKLAMEGVRGDEDITVKTSDKRRKFGVVDGSDIVNNVFDMIGLVDDVRVTRNANGQATVEVSGRDLMKLIVDDGSWFFNTSCCSNPEGVFWNINEYRKTGDIQNLNDGKLSLYRMRRFNDIDVFSNPQYMTVEFVLKTVLSQLSNIEVVPSSLFDAWGDKRTKFYDWYYEEEKK